MKQRQRLRELLRPALLTGPVGSTLTYDQMWMTMIGMSMAKRFNRLKAGTNLLYRRLTLWNMPVHMQIELSKALRGSTQAIPVIRRGGDFAATFCGSRRHFVDCIYQDKPSECALEDGKHALLIGLATTDSASSGQPVRITEGEF